MARTHNTRGAGFLAGCALVSLLWAACTDDFSRFKFGKNPPRSRDAGAQNVSDRAGSGDGATAKAKLQQAGHGGASTGVETGRSQARGTAGNPADDAQDLGDRDD
jgi:hypothetical protein